MSKTHLCVMTAVVAMAIGADNSAGDVVAHWKLDDRAGSPTAIDDVGGNDGTLLGNATFVTRGGVSGGAIRLQIATGDMVDCGDIFPMTGGVSFSIAVWAKMDPAQNTANRFPVMRHTAGTLNGYGIFLNQSGCYGAPARATAYHSSFCQDSPTSTTDIADGAWHHIVMAYDQSFTHIYVDGAPAEGFDNANLIQANAATLLFGGLYQGATPTPVFDGMIDDVQIYDHKLSDAQVQCMFDNPGEAVPPACDLSGNGVVDAEDLAQLLAQWGPCAGCAEDLDGDDTVGASDLATLLATWGPCPCP